MNTLVIKYILIGDSSVGKTSLLRHYSNNKFDNCYQSTIGIDKNIKHTIIKGYKVKNIIYDTAGQERFKSLIKNYYRGKDGAFIVFDLTNKNTFDNLNYWINEINLEEGNNKTKFIILGNKSDLNEIRQVSSDDIKEFEQKNNCKIIETSALDGSGIDRAFEEMFNLITFGMNEQQIYSKYIPNFNLKQLKNQNNKNNSEIKCC